MHIGEANNKINPSILPEVHPPLFLSEDRILSFSLPEERCRFDGYEPPWQPIVLSGTSKKSMAQASWPEYR